MGLIASSKKLMFKSEPPEPQNVILLGNRVIADVICENKMKSYLPMLGSSFSRIGVLVRWGKTLTRQGWNHVTTEAEIGADQLQVKVPKDCRKPSGSRNREGRVVSYRFQREVALLTLWFQASGLRAVNGSISVVTSYPISRTSLQQPFKTNMTLNNHYKY